MFSVLKCIYSFIKLQFLIWVSELLRRRRRVSCALTLILGLSFLRDLEGCVAMVLGSTEL